MPFFCLFVICNAKTFKLKSLKMLSLYRVVRNVPEAKRKLINRSRKEKALQVQNRPIVFFPSSYFRLPGNNKLFFLPTPNRKLPACAMFLQK